MNHLKVNSPSESDSKIRLLFWLAHSNPVTAAVFAPASVQNLLKSVQLRPLDSLQSDGLAQGQIIVTADITGQIKVFENNARLPEWLA